VDISYEDGILFKTVCNKLIGVEKIRSGIGTLGEKTVHAVLKNYVVPRMEYHEIKCNGYIADIMIEEEIIEIQTANFNQLRRKLEVFLPMYDVTIVYPVPAIKWLIWINEETGEITQKRKSNKKGTICSIFPELYKIKSYLKNPRLHLRIILLELEEYRLLNGWSTDKKKGSSRYDRIPINMIEDIMVNSIDDYDVFIPDSLPETFISKEFFKITGLTVKQGNAALNVLYSVGALERIGKEGRFILYKRKTNEKGEQNETIRRKGFK